MQMMKRKGIISGCKQRTGEIRQKSMSDAKMKPANSNYNVIQDLIALNRGSYNRRSKRSLVKEKSRWKNQAYQENLRREKNDMFGDGSSP